MNAKLLGQLNDVAASALEPGETLLFVSKANAPTSLKKAVSSAGAGAAGVAAGFAAIGLANARSGRLPADEIFGNKLPADLALALTDQHLIVCGCGGFGGKPKSVVVKVPLARIRSAEAGETKLSGLTWTALGIAFDDDSSTILVFPKPARGDADVLIRELIARLGCS